MRHVSVRNFEKYQHYTKRNPPWVKWHTKVLSDEHMASLSVGARLVYALMLLVAAQRENRIPEDPSWLAVEMMLPRKVIAPALAELLAENYLVRASNGASESAREMLSPETETENREVQDTNEVRRRRRREGS